MLPPLDLLAPARTTGRRWLVLVLASVAFTAVSLPVGPPLLADQNDRAVEVIDSWEVFDDDTFGDDEGRLPAFRPALTQAPNGDLIAAFNTSTDAHPGGQIRTVRSTDDGVTWGPSQIIATPSIYPGGSIHSSRGMTTLSDGTILLPYNDGVNYSDFNHRDSELFVASSSDSGMMWKGTDEPVELPVDTQEHWQTGRILETFDGTLLLPIWGTKELVEDWETNPQGWTSSVLRSFDGGETWEDYREVAHDPHNPSQFPPFHGAAYPSGANEASLEQLPDGRIVMAIRYATAIGPDEGRFFLSYSEDEGTTWTPPVVTNKKAETLAIRNSPCSDELEGGASKLLLGHRHLTDAGRIPTPDDPGGGAAGISASYDEGATWQDEVFLEDPGGRELGSFVAAEPDFHRLDDRRMLVIFQIQTEGPYRLAANLIEDADAEACQAAADAAQQRAEADVTVFLQREDRDAWAWPLALAHSSFPSDTLVTDVAADAAGQVTCTDERLQLWRLGDPDRPLAPARTLAEAGVEQGDVLQVRSLEPGSQRYRVGHAALDVFPESRHVYAWNDACDYSLELDRQARSLGVDVRTPPGQVLDAIELRAEGETSRLDVDADRLASEGGFLNSDTDPVTGSLGNFGFTSPAALDYQRRSVGADLGDVHTIDRVQIVDTDASSRLTAAHYTLWVSQDNETYERVEDWTFSADVVDGLLVHTFDDFEVEGRYIKLNTSYEGTDYSFVINDLAGDFRVYGECGSEDGCLVPAPYGVLVSDDNQRYEQLDEWSFESRVEDGRLVHRFADLGTTARYVKITQPYSDDNATFVLRSLRDDVSLEFAAPGDD